MHDCSVIMFREKDVRYIHCYTLDFSIEIHPHVHNCWEIALVKSGDLIYTADGRSVDIKPGSLIISPPGRLHFLKPKGTIIYDRHVLFVPEECLDRNILQQLSQDLYALDVSNNSMILGIFERAYYYVTSLQPEEARSALLSIGNELLINIYIATRNSPCNADVITDPLLVRILDYIDNHIRESLTVPSIGQAMSVSSGHLHRYFVKHMHMTPKQYIMQQKLLLVQQAMAGGANPTEICRQYGFGNYSTFYRNYQKAYGCRPSDNPRQSPQKIEL